MSTQTCYHDFALVETTADDWEEISSLALKEHVSEHTKMSHVDKAAIPPKLRYKNIYKTAQLQKKDNETGNSRC